MSLIPSAVQGATGDNYFVETDVGVLRQPTILPNIGSYGASSAELIMSNAVTDPSAHPMTVIHYVPAQAGGGLGPGLYQTFMYGPDVGAVPNQIGYLWCGRGLGNGNATLSINRGAPLDPARLGSMTGTGAPQAVPVPSITAGSIVQLAFVAGTPAVGIVPVTNTPNVGFTITIPAGSIYNFEVIG